jgi:hypothetical protein
MFTRLTAVALSLAAGATGALLLSRADTVGATDAPSAAVTANAFLKSLPADLRASASFPLDSPERLAGISFRWNASASRCSSSTTPERTARPAARDRAEPGRAARGARRHEAREHPAPRRDRGGVANASRRDPGLYYTACSASLGARPGPGASKGTTCRINVTQLPGSARRRAGVHGRESRARAHGPNAGFRLLAAEEDLGRELITHAVRRARQAAMIRDTAFADIVTGNDPKVQQLELEGSRARDMSAERRRSCAASIELYVGRVNAAAAKDALARLDRAGFEKVRFAWAGGIEAGSRTTTACTADAAHRVRRHAERRQSHPHGVSRSRA